jgi:hypothetical protein
VKGDVVGASDREREGEIVRWAERETERKGQKSTSMQ